MDLIGTLLSFLVSLGATILLTTQGFLGSVLPHDPPIVIIKPNIAASTQKISSQTLIGTTSPKTTVKKEIAKTTTKITPATTPVPTPPTPTIDPELLNTQTRDALVNILCLAKGGGVGSISGSGVFIDSRGIILTNAHIGEYFLLKDYPSVDNVDCTIRMGGPAQPRYRAQLLYLPPSWITKNASQIKAEVGQGNGENDYAFLLVTSSTGPTPLPSSYPSLPMATGGIDVGTQVFLAAYSAGFLGGSTIERSLYPTSAYAVIKDFFTYSNSASTIDLLSVGGTIVSQQGSSGGATVRSSDGKLVGLISAEVPAATTAERELYAITISHINRSLATEGKGGIVELLTQDAKQAVEAFARDIAPSEKAALVKVLDSH